MKDTLAEIHALTDAGIIGQSAIGGAMGATFYLEPISTFDLDIFVIFDSPALILTFSPIYEFLSKRGHQAEGGAIMIEGWPVQFLPADSPLLNEAVRNAVTIDFEGVPARVMTAEHLMAIALQTGRGKDFSRLLSFIETGGYDLARFERIVHGHSLESAWDRFKANFLRQA